MMKKVTAMLLLLALFMSLAVPASATGVEPCAACLSHEWQYRSTLVEGGGTPLNSQACISRWTETRTCKNCGLKETIGTKEQNDTHYNCGDMVIARCDGYHQTHHYYCHSCGITYPLVVIVCYGAPHGSVCNFLPM